jgi:hypothetical protein
MTRLILYGFGVYFALSFFVCLLVAAPALWTHWRWERRHGRRRY